MWGGALSRTQHPQGGGQTQPLLLTDAPGTLPTCAHVSLRAGRAEGRRPQETEGEGGTRLGACPAGGELGDQDLKTTRINRFMYQEQAKVFTS